MLYMMCVCVCVCLYIYIYISSVQSLSCVWLWPHGLQYSRLPCPSPAPESCSNSCPWPLMVGLNLLLKMETIYFAMKCLLYSKEPIRIWESDLILLGRQSDIAGPTPSWMGWSFPPQLRHWWSEQAQRSSHLWPRTASRDPAVSRPSKTKLPAQVDAGAPRLKGDSRYQDSLCYICNKLELWFCPQLHGFHLGAYG